MSDLVYQIRQRGHPCSQPVEASSYSSRVNPDIFNDPDVESLTINYRDGMELLFTRKEDHE